MLDLPNAACMHRRVATYVLGAMDTEEGRGEFRVPYADCHKE